MSTLKNACRHHLSYDRPAKAADILRQLADYADDFHVDISGQGDLAQKVADRVRDLLGAEAAVFMPSGKTAQNIAFKIWCERRGYPSIAVHPRSHVELVEGKGYAHVFGLDAVGFGLTDRQTTAADVDALPGHLGAASIEIALRPLGCPVVPWDDLVAMSQKLRARGIPFHGDCARIWEAQPFLDHSLPEIAGLFDSLYVSVYKGIGGLAGAVLLGPAELIAEARIWQIRLGMTMPRQFPYQLSALKGLDERLPLIPEFCRKARSFAAALSTIDGVSVTPDPPHTNAFQVVVRGRASAMAAARDEVAKRLGFWLYDIALPSPIDGLAIFEVHVWTAGLAVSEDEAVEAMRLFASLIR